MQPVALSDTIAVGEFPTKDLVEILAKAGFRALLNNQPDGEVERLPKGDEIAAEAARHGLVYRALPLAGRRLGDAEVAEFTRALSELPRPIYAFCYSGAKSTAAWALAAAEHASPDTVIKACEAAGYDVTFLHEALAARRTAATAASSAAAAAMTNGSGNGHVNGAPVNGSSNGNTAGMPPAPPMLAPQIVLPRAGGAGGFTVAG